MQLSTNMHFHSNMPKKKIIITLESTNYEMSKFLIKIILGEL